MLWNAKELGKN